MKKLIYLPLALLFIGCSNKAPSFNDNNVQDATSFTETTSINENGINSNNGSSDGFQSVYFEFGKYSLNSSMDATIVKNIAIAKKTNRKIKIEGNCDEFGSDEYNFALGLKRANSIRGILKDVNINNTVIVSLGESNPLCSDMSDSCYSKNRRVDFSLVD